MEKISPKKYLETKVRNLPIYKCLITSTWRVMSMANVMVMRKHVTGNVTVGYYLIDLLCLGVKDTHYHFNVSEEEATEQFGETFEFMEETDYNLAHNVIFAAYEFALQFDIPPHKDFKLTKFILEEDNDNIPLIEIHTGASDGKPHLIINQMGQGKWALDKLIKNAGEDNYYYSVVDDLDEEEFDDENYLPYATLDEFPFGTISAFDASLLPMEEIIDQEKIQARAENEIATLVLESTMRILQMGEQCISEDDFKAKDEYYLTEIAEEQINSADGPVNLAELDEDGSIRHELAQLSKLDGTVFEKKLTNILSHHSDNLFAAERLYQYNLMNNNQDIHNKVCLQLNSLSDKYPYAKLILAFDAAFNNAPDLRFSKIIYSKTIQECFEGYNDFGTEELFVYWLIKILKSIKDNKLADAAFYYKLAINSCTENVFFWLTQEKLMNYFSEALEPTE